MSFLEVMDPGFRQAANVLWNSPNMDGHTSYSAHRVKKGIDATLKEAQKIQLEIANKYCRKSKTGPAEDAPEILLRDENGNYLFEDDEKLKAFDREFTEVFSQKFMELKVNKIDFQAIGGMKGLTPNHWPYLEFIVENLPEEDPLEESR
jgi:hypothetical protein